MKIILLYAFVFILFVVSPLFQEDLTITQIPQLDPNSPSKLADFRITFLKKWTNSCYDPNGNEQDYLYRMVTGTDLDTVLIDIVNRKITTWNMYGGLKLSKKFQAALEVNYKSIIDEIKRTRQDPLDPDKKVTDTYTRNNEGMDNVYLSFFYFPPTSPLTNGFLTIKLPTTSLDTDIEYILAEKQLDLHFGAFGMTEFVSFLGIHYNLSYKHRLKYTELGLEQVPADQVFFICSLFSRIKAVEISLQLTNRWDLGNSYIRKTDTSISEEMMLPITRLSQVDPQLTLCLSKKLKLYIQSQIPLSGNACEKSFGVKLACVYTIIKKKAKSK